MENEIKIEIWRTEPARGIRKLTMKRRTKTHDKEEDKIWRLKHKSSKNPRRKHNSHKEEEKNPDLAKWKVSCRGRWWEKEEESGYLGRKMEKENEIIDKELEKMKRKPTKTIKKKEKEINKNNWEKGMETTNRNNREKGKKNQ